MKRTKRGNKYCYPKINKTKKKNYSCFNKKHLIKMIKEWNKQNKQDKIKYKDTDKLSLLWKKLDSKINNCDSEWCWLDKLVKDKNKFKNIFRPKHPKSWLKNKNEWLSNVDIERVLNQYQDIYDDFVFLGAIPIDFDYKIFDKCVSEKLCKLKIKNYLNKGITKIGIIFNTDKHHQPGSHWISLFIDLKRKGIYYFDSVGIIYPEEINKLIYKISKQCELLKYDMSIEYNKNNHQLGNSECGVYSIHFIITMATKNISFKAFCDNVIHDKDIFKKRQIYFISPN